MWDDCPPLNTGIQVNDTSDPLIHSCLRAIMGSTFEARRAGR